jgi:hypothetical protein
MEVDDDVSFCARTSSRMRWVYNSDIWENCSIGRWWDKDPRSVLNAYVYTFSAGRVHQHFHYQWTSHPASRGQDAPQPILLIYIGSTILVIYMCVQQVSVNVSKYNRKYVLRTRHGCLYS